MSGSLPPLGTHKQLKATDEDRETRECTRCQYTGPATSFPITTGLQRSSSCRSCTEYRQRLNQEARNARKGKSNKENEEPAENGNGAATGAATGAESKMPKTTPMVSTTVTWPMKWNALATYLSKCAIEETRDIDLVVKIPRELESKDGKAARVALASEVLACTGYRFK